MPDRLYYLHYQTATRLGKVSGGLLPIPYRICTHHDLGVSLVGLGLTDGYL